MPNSPEEFEKPPAVPQEILDWFERLQNAIAALSGIDPRPLDPGPPAMPRLIWHQYLDDENDKGGWIVEFGPFAIMHPYTYVDEFGEDDELSQKIIQVTDYRNRKQTPEGDILK